MDVIVSHFSGVTIFTQFFKLTFPICSTILCMPISTVFFLVFPTWGSHSHFVRVRYMTRGPIGTSIVCFGSPSHFLPYINNQPYLCFLFLIGWYTYIKFCIICGSYIFTIARNFFSISAPSEVCSLVSIGVRPFYITSSLLSYFWFEFSYF